MQENNPANMSNKDLENDVNTNNVQKSDKAENHSTASDGFLPGEESEYPLSQKFDPAEEHDLDDVVHSAPPASEGSLPDPEATSLDEDGEYDRDRIANK